jgi:hypothetical protein
MNAWVFRDRRVYADGAGRNDETEPYVATPGGGKRELNDDEKALIMMEKYKQTPKKKSLVFQEEV